jgi:hypothetical protein
MDLCNLGLVNTQILLLILASIHLTGGEVRDARAADEWISGKITEYFNDLPEVGKCLVFNGKIERFSIIDVGTNGNKKSDGDMSEMSYVSKIGRTALNGYFIVEKNAQTSELLSAALVDHDKVEVAYPDGSLYISSSASNALDDRFDSAVSVSGAPFLKALKQFRNNWRQAIIGIEGKGSGSENSSAIKSPILNVRLDRDGFSIGRIDETNQSRYVWLSIRLSQVDNSIVSMREWYSTLNSEELFSVMDYTTGQIRGKSGIAHAVTPVKVKSSVTQSFDFDKVDECRKISSLTEVIDIKSIYDADSGLAVDK